jgi:hypothetical protein
MSRAPYEAKKISWPPFYKVFFAVHRDRRPINPVAGEDLPPRLENTMKKLYVVIAGTGQIRDVEIGSGTTAGDILHQLNLGEYLLSKGPNEPFFAAAESIYDKVNDGEKIFASTKAEVGITVCA